MKKYKHTHPTLPPAIFTSIFDGKKYIVPGWKEVSKNIILKDAEWVKEEIKIKKTEIEIFEFKSSSGDEVYIAKKYINLDGSIKYGCSCPGVWRSKNRKCKHILEIEKNG